MIDVNVPVIHNKGMIKANRMMIIKNVSFITISSSHFVFSSLPII